MEVVLQTMSAQNAAQLIGMMDDSVQALNEVRQNWKLMTISRLSINNSSS